MHQDREVAHPVRNLVRRDGEGRHKAQRKTRQESRSDQHSVERVMNAIADDDEDTRRGGATMVVPIVVRTSVVMTVIMTVRVAIAVIVRMRLVPVPINPMLVRVPIPMRVPPQHQLFDDEKHPEPDEQCRADGVRALRPNTLHRLGQQRQQCRPKQCARRVTDEVRQKTPPRCIRHQKEQPCERRAGYPADGGKEDDPDEQRQGRERFSTDVM